ncbi:MAG: response regulator [Alphaproteobacteria bacterium]|nr:response regulator [Alphaproteobacteria bacterium]
MSLDGVRILLVEDEAIIAMTAEDMAGALGCRIVASAATLAEALAAAERGGFDVALLDINLNGVDSLPAAAWLKRQGLPFVFTTGYGSSGRDPAYDDVPLVTKPYRLADLGAAIAEALGR